MNMTYRSKKQITKLMASSSQLLTILMSKLRCSLGAAWEQAGTRFLRPFSSKRAELERRLVMSMLLMLTLGSGSVWGQDYSGVYYIASDRGYNAETPNNNFFLCPTEGWAFYKATNDVQPDDNGQPFLTTYKCKGGGYDLNKAVWIVEKDPNSGCYYIKQALTGKYMVSNGVLTGA